MYINLRNLLLAWQSEQWPKMSKKWCIMSENKNEWYTQTKKCTIQMKAWSAIYNCYKVMLRAWSAAQAIRGECLTLRTHAGEFRGMFVNLWSWQAHEGTASILQLLVTPVGPWFEKTTVSGYCQHLTWLFKISQAFKSQDLQHMLLLLFKINSGHTRQLN